MPARCIRILVGAAVALALTPGATSAAGQEPAAMGAELVPRLALASQVVQITSRYGVGFVTGGCNEPQRDFCSLAARLYHTLTPTSSRQVRIGTVAGTAAGGSSGRLGFILNIPGWTLLRARRRLTVTLRGTIVHGGMLLGRVDQKLDLRLVP